jgi:ribosomal protein S18 acetylase RimI-like enzyme
MDREAALAAFEGQMRRGARAPGSGATIEDVGDVVRYVATTDDGWSAVLWSDLDEATADAAIAREVRHFAGLGRRFEWKLYAHDRPSDLGARLVAAGFEAGGDEAFMVAEIADLDTAVALPPGLRVLAVSNEASAGLMVRVHEEVFGVDHGWLGAALLAQIAEAPETLEAVVVMAGDVPVSSGRLELHRGTEFASLWGGGTLPAFRGRGIYRALVAHRAKIAAERGFRYLTVDAMPASEAILARLGFVRLATTREYVRDPDPG